MLRRVPVPIRPPITYPSTTSLFPACQRVTAQSVSYQRVCRDRYSEYVILAPVHTIRFPGKAHEFRQLQGDAIRCMSRSISRCVRRLQVKVSATAAQRKVSRLVLDRVSNLLCGNPPTLGGAERLRWRVPVWLGFPKLGLVGRVGEIDVDVETGEMIFDETRLRRRANAPMHLLDAPHFGQACAVITRR